MRQQRIGTTLLPLILVIVGALSLAPAIRAQIGGGGSIQGTVSDPNGAVVPGATVVATNIATQVEATRQSNDSGVYVVSPLPPGEYKVVVTADGFRTLIQENVIVDALTAVTVNLKLEVGSVQEAITVSDSPNALNLNDPRLGTTIRNDLYTALPLAMGTSVAGAGIGQGPRNPGSFIYLLPGVTEGNRWGQINGAQGFSKDVFIEGVPVTDPIQQGEGRTIALGVSVEAVEQFQVETSGTGVEFNGQGSENYTIKSGGNQFHGSGFEYFRNTSLDAKPFFSNLRPPEHQNEFGFTIGGPIIKKKLFFFFSYDGWRYRVTSAAQAVSIPSLKMRMGDFSELLPTAVIYDPMSTVCVAGVCTRTPFPGNIIPPSRISAISKVYQSLLPQPTSAGVQGNYLGVVPVGYDNNNYNLKIDYSLTESQTLSGIFTRGKRSQSGPYREISSTVLQTALPLPYTSTRLVTEIPTVFQLKHSWTISPSLVNQVSFGFNHFFVPITNATSADHWAEKSGIQGLPPGDAQDAFLEATFAGNNSPTGWRGTDARDFEDNNYNYTVQDNVLYLRGNHSFKFGGQYQKTYDKVKNDDTGSLFVANFSNNQTAGFSSGSTLNANTGNAYASYLLGALSSATVLLDTVSGATPTTAQFSTTSFWVADDWKFNKRLTINLGVRYDLMTPYTEKDDHFTFLDPTIPNPAAGGRLGVLRFGGNYAPDAISCHCSQIVNTYKNAWGPRVGFAFAWNDKTTIRAGYGIFYTRRGAVGGRENARLGSGFTGLNASPALAAPNGFDPAFYWQNGIPPFVTGPIYDQTYLTGFNAPNVTGGTLTYADPNSQPPRYQNWNFSIQRAITSTMVLTAAYVGSNGKQLAGAGRGSWSNQIDPSYLKLGSLLNMTANPTNVALAAAIIPGIRLPFPTFSGTIAQMLRPFPQYGGIADPYGNVGQSNYNALQTSLQQRLSQGLTFNINYTFSKALGTINGIRTAYKQENSLSTTDQTHVFNAFFTYELPFGKGKNFDVSNRTLRYLISGWRISGITRYATGAPLVFTASCTLPASAFTTCFPSYNPNFTGSVRINGDWGDGSPRPGAGQTPYLDKNAFANPAAFTYGTAPPTGAYGLRNPAFVNQDLSLARDFKVRESLKIGFGVDVFNLMNTVRFGAINTNINSTAFGTVNAQANLPRVVQFKLRADF
jgi:hypothetical protein